MCGIAGILYSTPGIRSTEEIDRMTGCIAHRGPDDHRLYTDDHIALGHRRLAIIDLTAAANQPMADASGNKVIVFNGEIYNFQEVKALIPEYPFKTHSDTEVILAAFNKWGESCLDKLNGMFAFAIWDKAEKSLFIARDRLGKKPFYYYQGNGFFIFSSELRSLLSFGMIPRELDESQLPEYFMYQAPLGGHTLIKNVKQLGAGHCATVKLDQIEERSYWHYSNISVSGDNYQTTKDTIRDLLMDAVRIRMIADVKIGAFLSGGIDSSLIVACMAELSHQPIHTFTISFKERSFDESGFAQQIATKYKTDHHRIVIDPNEFLYSVDEILGAMDSPSGDGPNTYLVAKHTRSKGIKVALSGLGGDELFAGYNKFLLYHKIMKYRWIASIPAAIRVKLSNILLLSAGDYKDAKIADLVAMNAWKLSTVYPSLRRSYRKEGISRLLSGRHTLDDVEIKLEAIEKSLNGMGSLSKCSIGELETYTKDVLLRDTDQMAMAHGLEVRVPFFDYRLVEYVLSVQDKYKYPRTPKKLLVDSFADRLPANIVERRKMGFSFPMEKWLRNELSGMVTEKLKYLADRKEFNGDIVLRSWKYFREGDKNVLWPHIWQMTVLSDWLQRNKM